MKTRPSVPSWDSASSRPLLARKLNERSFSPPMSVTRPVLMDLPPLSLELLVLPPPLSSSPPQAAIPRASAASSAKRVKRKDLRTVESPHWVRDGATLHRLL